VAIYRPPKPRWPLAVAAFLGGLILGALVAFLLQGDPDPAAIAADVDAELAAAAASLEVVAVEYEESVEEGEVVQEAEFRGAESALASSRTRYEAVAAAVETLAPERAAAIDGAYVDAEGLMNERASAEELSDVLADLEELLRGDT